MQAEVLPIGLALFDLVHLRQRILEGEIDTGICVFVEDLQSFSLEGALGGGLLGLENLFSSCSLELIFFFLPNHFAELIVLPPLDDGRGRTPEPPAYSSNYLARLLAIVKTVLIISL